MNFRKMAVNLLTGAVCLMTLSQAMPVKASETTDTKEVTYISGQTDWKYEDTNTDQYTLQFFGSSFDDQTWKQGKAPFGYPLGEENSTFGGISTVVQNQDKPNAYITYYFKKDFAVDDATLVKGLHATVGIDDGFVMYINGTEVNRTNMNEGVITHDTASNYVNETSSDRGTVVLDLSEYTNLLKTGENDIAVSVHNRDQNSSDIYFDMSLTGIVAEKPPVKIEGAVDVSITGTELAVIQNGEMIDCYINMNQAENVNTFRAKVKYDTTVLHLEKTECCFDDVLLNTVEEKDGVIDALMGLQNVKTITESTKVMHLQFKALEGITIDKTEIRLESFECASVKNEEGINNEVNKTEDTMEVILYTYEYGSDINRDGKITLADLSIALANYQKSEDSCDINKDGTVDVLDYVIIAGFLK